jgi:hypothetical protein
MTHTGSPHTPSICNTSTSSPGTGTRSIHTLGAALTLTLTMTLGPTVSLGGRSVWLITSSVIIICGELYLTDILALSLLRILGYMI